MSLCIISEYADAEELVFFFFSNVIFRMENRKKCYWNVQSGGEGWYIQLAVDSAHSKCISQGVWVPGSQIAAVVERTSQGYAL